MDSIEAPDRSWQRTLFILFFAQLITAVGFSTIFPFLPLYVDVLGSAWGLSLEFLAGMVYSAQAFTMMLASPIWGSLADRFGRKLMVVRAMYGGALLLLLMAFVRSAEELVLLRALQGLVTGTVAAASALLAAIVPKERMGFAMGMLQVGLGTGIAVGPVIGGVVADRYGYQAAFYVTALLLLMAGVIVTLGVHEKFVPVRRAAGGSRSFVSVWRALVAQKGVRVTYLLRFMSGVGRMMIIPILPLMVKMLIGSSPKLNTFTGLVIGLGSAATTVSSFFLGWAGDHIGHRKILVASTLLVGVSYFPMSMVSTGKQLLALQGLAGVALGGVIPMISALLARYSPSGDAGSVYGLDNSINAGARTLAPLMGAAIAGWFGLRVSFPAAAAFFVLTGMIALWQLPHPRSGKGSLLVRA